MKSDPLNLRALFEPVIGSLGYELVGVEHAGAGGVLRVYIDTADGITVDDCALVSRQLSALLDVEDPIPGRYTLEVSSPGLDRPLFGAQDFVRFAGQQVSIRLDRALDGRRKFKGLLRGLEQQDVVIEQDGEEVRLPVDRIEMARLVPQF